MQTSVCCPVMAVQQDRDICVQSDDDSLYRLVRNVARLGVASEVSMKLFCLLGGYIKARDQYRKGSECFLKGNVLGC